MTESNFEIEIKKRATRRMKGALVLVLLAALIFLPFLIGPAPTDNNESLFINIIRPDVEEKHFDISPLPKADIADAEVLAKKSKSTPKRIVVPPAKTSVDKLETASPASEKTANLVLVSPSFVSNEAFITLSRALDKANITYQKKPDITETGRAEITLIFGPFANEQQANAEKKQLLSSFKSLKRLELIQE